MANQWTNPWYQHDRHIPSTLEDPTQAGQWQIETQSDANATIPRCSCALCSATRQDNQLAWPRTMQHQGPSLPGVGTLAFSKAVPSSDFDTSPKDPSVPLGNRNIDVANPAGVTAIVNNQVVAQFRTPQAPWVQDEAGYAPPQEAACPIQVQTSVGLEQAQNPDVSVTENLRRVADSYFNNPEALVNAIRLEPGHSGRLQVVITLEIAGIR